MRAKNGKNEKTVRTKMRAKNGKNEKTVRKKMGAKKTGKMKKV